MGLSQRRLLQFFAVPRRVGAGRRRCGSCRCSSCGTITTSSARSGSRSGRSTLNPVRGSILDARGRVLAESIAAESIYADPQAIARSRAVREALASDPRHRPDRARDRSEAARRRQLRLDRAAAAARSRRPKCASCSCRASTSSRRIAAPIRGRRSPRTSSATSASTATVSAGIEHSFDEHVRRHAGQGHAAQATRGAACISSAATAPNRPRDGHHVVLTIDSVIQFIAERALQQAVDAVPRHRRLGDRDGSERRRDPGHGLVRRRSIRIASASSPPWRGATATCRISTSRDRRSRSSRPRRDSKSGSSRRRRCIDCGNGAITIANITISEHDGNRYGLLSFEDVIVNSSNVGTVRVGLALGRAALLRLDPPFRLRRARPGCRCRAKQSGMLRRAEKWTQVSPASISIGQEIGVTPLQIVRAVASVATGGMLRRAAHREARRRRRGQDRLRAAARARRGA